MTELSGFDRWYQSAIEGARLWARTTCFADVKPALRNADGRYLTDSTDTKVIDTLLDLWAKSPTQVATAGKKRIAQLAGVTPNSALAALRRLSPEFVEIGESTEFGMVLAPGKVISAELTPYRGNCNTGVNSAEMTFDNEYSPRKAMDVYLSGTSRQVKRLMREATQGDYWYPPQAEDSDEYSELYAAAVAYVESSGGDLEPYVTACAAAWATGDTSAALAAEARLRQARADVGDEVAKRFDLATMAAQRQRRAWMAERSGLGETGLRILDALVRCGEMTVKDLAAETGKTHSAIADAMSKLARVGAVEWTKEGPRSAKVWEFVSTFDEIEAHAHEMRTHGMAASREDAMLEQSQLWVAHQHRAARTQEDRDAAWRRGVKLENRRTDCLMRLHGWDESAARAVAADLPYRQWLGRRASQAQARREADERIAEFETAEAQRATVAAQVADLPRNEAARMLRIAGHDAGDIARLAQVAA